MKRLMETREKFVTAVWQYEKRKAKIQEKFQYFPQGRHRGDPAPSGYREAVNKMNIKLKAWKAGIKRMDRHMAGLKEANSLIHRFMSVDVRGIGNRPKLEDEKLARAIFCKYMLETYRTPQPFIVRHLGFIKDSVRVGGIRREFTKSFSTNAKNKEMYHRFLEFVKNPY